VDSPVGDSFAAGANSAASLIAWLAKIWIGYLLAFATLVGEMIAVARNPELAKGRTLPPFRPRFISPRLWQLFTGWSARSSYHVVLANVPGWQHPISPARAVWCHFIPVYVVYWVLRWPAAIADFVNQRLQAPVMNKWTIGTMFSASLLCRLFVDSALSAAMLFFACTYISGFLQRALAVPVASQA
jgi:hypothetical protein